MSRSIFLSTLLTALVLGTTSGVAVADPATTESATTTATLDAPAPEFQLTGIDGKLHKLSDYKGSIVVLEWWNNECPFVKRHYDAGTIQKLQAKLTKKQVIWLTISSSAPGKQGYVDAVKAAALVTKNNAHPTTVLLDETGDVGRRFGARTTPHMFVIDTKGLLRYAGAFDNLPSTNASALASVNYVNEAISQLEAGEIVKPPSSTPYGCSVKY